MFKQLGKYIFMIELGFKYIKIFKKTFFHPFIPLKYGYEQLSVDRQGYSNKVLEFLNIDVTFSGEIPQKNKILYVINHRSLLDIIVMEHIFSQYGKNGVWIAKEELFSAFYGDFFRFSGCISVDIENKKGFLKFFKQIKEALLKVDNLNIYIFPEGERYKGEGVKEFQNGAAKIAKANNLKIVPVYIDEKLEKVFKDSPFQQRKMIHVYIGKYIEPDQLQSEYIHFMNKVKGNEIE